MKKLTVLIALLTVIASSSMAQNWGEKNASSKNGKAYSQNWDNNRFENRGGRNGAAMRINSFQKQAREKIAYGIIDGSITSFEAKRLLEFAEKIEMKKNRFMRNGRLTEMESRELNKDLVALNRMIAREKRDGQHSNADVYVHSKRRPSY